MKRSRKYRRGGSCKSSGKKRFFGLFLSALLLMWLWNWLVPDLFGWPAINYLQAVLMMLIGRLLSGRRRHSNKERHGKDEMSCKGKWRGHFEAKWAEKEANEHEEEGDVAESKPAKDDTDYKEGFTSGKWEVNVVDVNEEVEEEDSDPTEESPSEDENDTDK